jgi:glycosyltransferase involved in cell wall biosynthesis
VTNVISARVHLTNVAGAGAMQVIQSLLPALERDGRAAISDLYLPDRGALATYQPARASTRATTYRRVLPNALSRLLECTVLGGRFDGESPLLVLGDIPLRCNAAQTVFVHQSHLLRPAGARWALGDIRFAISRAVFARTLRYAKAFIVQTPSMQQALVDSYPSLEGKVHVIPQPAPRWLLDARLDRKGRQGPLDAKLDLLYPAVEYPHKNHQLLGGVRSGDAADWPVRRLVPTLERSRNPAPEVPWVECVGLLGAPAMIEAYRRADALLFLSLAESYGLPLVEAMIAGLPIVCPDLPYARTLCGDEAIYFDPRDVRSLRGALESLRTRLNSGWWPDWRGRLASIPSDWEQVARQMLTVVFGDDR